MRRYRGFTLAEVLITLGIIGVVAAMTIPTLIANTNSKRFASQFKKSISTLKQAVLLAQAHYDADLSNVRGRCINGSTDTIDDMTICGLFNTTLAGATFIPQETISINREKLDHTTCGAGPNMLGYMLADGSTFYFTQQDETCTQENPCCGFIDVNGFTLPNKEVSGVIKTSYNNLVFPAAYAAGDNYKFRPYFYVPADSTHMTDVYPINLYGQTVQPATPAAEYVLTGISKGVTPEEACEARSGEGRTCHYVEGECRCIHSGGSGE